MIFNKGNNFILDGYGFIQAIVKQTIIHIGFDNYFANTHILLTSFLLLFVCALPNLINI